MAKVAAYLLNGQHSEGGPKARFFTGFGFDPANPALLRQTLLAHPTSNEVIATGVDEFGVRSVVQCLISSPVGRDPCIRSVWMQNSGVQEQRLITAYPALQRLSR